MSNHYGTTSDADVTPTSKVLSIDGDGPSVTIPTCKRALDVDNQDGPPSRVRVSTATAGCGSSNKYPIFVSDSDVSMILSFEKKTNASPASQDINVVPDSQTEPILAAVNDDVEPKSGGCGASVSATEDVVSLKDVGGDLVP